MQYRREIDGLRALAVLPVILFHADINIFNGGFVGVDVFFVLSGYLITRLIVNEIDFGTFSIAGFYERRARRILPALFFIMACSLPFAWILLLPSDFVDFSQSLVANPLFVANFLYRESHNSQRRKMILVCRVNWLLSALYLGSKWRKRDDYRCSTSKNPSTFCNVR